MIASYIMLWFSGDAGPLTLQGPQLQNTDLCRVRRLAGDRE
jgi:hypothetical protein